MSNRSKIRAAGLLSVLWLAGAGAPVLARGDPQAAPATSGSTAPASQDAFYRNMQLMHAQMLQLQATKDPAARAKLLEEHMRTMQATMPMMGGGSAPMRGSGMGAGMMRGRMMGNGQMMQAMMGQMLQHQQAMQAMGCIK